MNSNEYKNILVFAEVCEHKPADNSLELLGEANRLKQQLGNDTKVIAALLGNNITALADTLFRYGADIVVTFNDKKLETCRSDLYGEALAKIIEKQKPEIVLIGATYMGSELAPTVAAKLKTGLAAHCTELKIDEKLQLVQVVPAFGGKVLGDIITPNHRPQMASVKAGITQKMEPREFTGTIEDFHGDLNGFGDRIKIVGRHEEKAHGKSLHESDCIIGGGFGIGSKENWSILEELATLLHGATGSTRPALDEGWTCGEHTMIGTSGVAVRPKIYINAGISGAAHHTCGIKDTGVIISINRDPNAPIFAVSDFKIVSDWKKIIPLVVEKLR